MAFLQTFINVVMIVILAVPGFALRKVRLLPDKAASIFAVLLLYISQPFLMMASLFNKEFQPSMLVNFGWVLLFAVVLQLLVYFVSKLVFCKTKEEASRRACVACSYLGNVGFMGIPVMEMLFPGNSDMVLYTVVYNIAFNAMSWTLGVFTITGEKKRINPLKIVLNPPMIAVIVSLPFFFLNVHIPEQVMTPISYLGDMTLPLSMVILGVRLADMRLVRAKSAVPAQGEAAREVAAGVSPVCAPAVTAEAETESVSPVSYGCTDEEACGILSVSEEIADESLPPEEIADENSAPADGAAETVPAPKPRPGILDDPKVYLVAAVKLILSPLLSLGVLLLFDLIFPLDRFVVIALFIIAAMPTASSALNFAEMFGGDKETAAASTLMNTILCIVTIPILMLLCDII